MNLIQEQKPGSSQLGEKHLKWAFLVAILLAVLGIALMGLPGAAVLAANECVLASIGFKLRCTQGDAAWPAAIYASLAYPAFVPLVYWIAFRKLTLKQTVQRWIVFFVGMLIASFILTFALESLCRLPK